MDDVAHLSSTEVPGSSPVEEKTPKDLPSDPRPRAAGSRWQEDPAVLDWLLSGGEDRTLEISPAAQPPLMYHELLWRDWQDLCDPAPIGALPPPPFDFAVLSYNILSQDLVEQNRQLYVHCAPLILRWDYRWPNILQELQHWEADILCLQEVQDDHYREQVQPALSALGYSCHYKRRTGRKTDGCCTCFRAQSFTLLAESPLEFFRPAIDVLNRDNVGLVLVLQPRLPEGTEDAAPPPRLCVVNTHLLYNPRRGDIKLAQLALLLAEVERLSRDPAGGARCPIILCGDLNATPSSPLYQLLSNGVLNYSGLPAWKVSGQERYCSHPCPRLLSPPLWPDLLGISDTCRYISPQGAALRDRRTYTRQRLLELRYCDCALQRPPQLVIIKGVTDNTPDPCREPAYDLLNNGAPAYRPQPLLLQHHLDLTSAYSHFLPAKGRHEVTTMTMGAGSTVDYIFYSGSRHGARSGAGAGLRLLGRLCLLSEEDLWAAQGLPNPFCCSDHLCLLARFSLDLWAGAK